MKKFWIFGLIFLLGSSFTVSCKKNYLETSRETRFPWYPTETVNRNLQTILITSEASRLCAQEVDVYRELKKVIHSELYNVVSVKTFYSDRYLTAAEITYNPFGVGEGNGICIIFLFSDKDSYPEIEEEVKKWTEEIERWMNSDDCVYGIVETQKVYVKGYFVVTEFYVRVKQNKEK